MNVTQARLQVCLSLLISLSVFSSVHLLSVCSLVCHKTADFDEQSEDTAVHHQHHPSQASCLFLCTLYLSVHLSVCLSMNQQVCL